MKQPSLEKFTSEKFLVGASYALENAVELFNDGLLLLNNNRIYRAYTIFQLSIEESGKVVMLLDAFYNQKLYEKNPELFEKVDIVNYYKNISKYFYSHPEKMKYMLEYELKNFNGFMDYFNIGNEPSITKTRDDIIDDLQKIESYNNSKNLSLYSSIFFDTFAKPEKFFEKKEVEIFMHKAFQKLMLTKNKTIRFLSDRELPKEINLEKLKNLQLKG